MHTLIRAGFIALAFLCSMDVRAQDAIPPSLREWQGWVLHGEEFRRCPLAASFVNPGAAASPAQYRCVWPERLTLTVDARGGTFSQRWQVYAESWVALPGSIEHWPRDVRLNGAPAALVAVNDVPNLRLPAGSHVISGRFAWSSRPEALPLADATAIIDLFVDGTRVAQPERPDGGVWLGKRRSAEQPANMEVQVYRLIQDDIPVYLVTRLRLNVAGDAREEVLARVLPEGFTPVSLTGALPARLERDGRLRVQVRPGSHELTLVARGAGVASSFTRPDASGGKWAREEIWSFASNDLQRVAAAEGAEGIDPAQANVPSEWRQYPAFRMDATAKLDVQERSRGLVNADDNRLSLTRNLWLDFDHGGFTAVDRLEGTMRRDWRLDMQAPFQLASARQDGDQLLVTAGDQGRAGIELRRPQLSLTTVARKESGGGAMPATGWNGRFDRVVGTLHLPTGHRLLAAVGADAAPASWWEQWGLWNVFGVLIVVVFVYWTAGLIPAAIAALGLVLTYQEAPDYIWLWGNLLAAMAVARAAPEGHFRKFAHAWRTLSFTALGLALLPFLVMQYRYALYPQLSPQQQAADLSDGSVNVENPYGIEALWSEGPGVFDMLRRSRQPMPAAAPPPPPRPARDFENRVVVSGLMGESVSAPADAAARIEADVAAPREMSALNSAQVVPRYAAGTVLQAGPGIPAWRYNSYNYFWTGPVEAADTVRFIYVGPVVMFLWRIIGALAVSLLFLWLANLSFGGTLRLPVMPRGMRGAAASALVLLIAFTAVSPASAQAQSNMAPGRPGDDLLAELKSRLTAPPRCAPRCVEITAANVTVAGERLDVVLQVSALANIAVAMPHASDRWQLDEVTVDSRTAMALARNRDASLWVPLTPGAHSVRLSGRLAAAESVQLAFPQPPRVIDVRATGWTVNGVNESRLVAGQLELSRERTEQRAGATLEAGSEFPGFVRVERVFNLDLDWTIDTEVQRVSPQRAALSVEIPLVKGESVLTPGVEVRNGEVALVGLTTGERATRWHSGLSRADSLELSMPADAARSEVWSFFVNPQWSVSFEGFAPVLPENVNGAVWVFRYMPRPGEKLVLKVTRPQPVSGSTLAIDSVKQIIEVGNRTSNTTLRFSSRSTQGGRHVIKLPQDARVTSVLFDEQPQQLRPEKGELPLALMPGSHDIQVQWERPQDVGVRTHPPAVDLRSPASNIQFQITLPESRWPLFVSGPGIGPAVLYWGELVVFIGIAWLLGQWSRSPLRFSEWLLLGLGLSTQSWWVFTFTALWLIAMKWREGWVPAAEESRMRFNVVQVVLAVFTLFVITTLVFSGIRNGLLAAPDMGIADLNYGNGAMWWFLDQTDGVIEAPTIISVPMWVYRALFFAWASWMAFALVRWLRWAFNAWKTNGLWRGAAPLS
ncbi:MAG TPA: hypothetical protein VFU13_13065 [Steroidobacteraceae bacterium]|nr:hypothetical protein [Steroidobacteraceae bacterium]